MTTLTIPETPAALLERVVMHGDLSKLTHDERLRYYTAVCESVGLNPLTRPFDYLTLSGKLTLYARKDCTEQLRKIHGVSIYKLERERHDDLYVVTAYARDKHGREDSDMGAVSIKGLTGEALANAILKTVTKAKRRVTLSICGLGMLDETEVETVPGARPVRVDPETGEVLERGATVVTPDSLLGGLVSATEGATPGADLAPAAPDAGPSETQIALKRSWIQARRDNLKMTPAVWARFLEQHAGVTDLGQASLDGLDQLELALGKKA